MAVLLDRNTRLVVQGLTGREGTFHAKQAAAYGTSVVGGVTPGKGGTTHEGWPVFDTVREAVDRGGDAAALAYGVSLFPHYSETRDSIRPRQNAPFPSCRLAPIVERSWPPHARKSILPRRSFDAVRIPF